MSVVKLGKPYRQQLQQRFKGRRGCNSGSKRVDWFSSGSSVVFDVEDEIHFPCLVALACIGREFDFC